MKLYQQFHLSCMPILQDYTREVLSDHNELDLYVIYRDLPPDIKNLLDTELHSYGLADSYSFIFIKRINVTTVEKSGTHIDTERETGRLNHVSIVVPISGCDDTYMFWHDGDYEIRDIEEPIKHRGIFWNSPPNVLDKVHIINTPMICRSDIPHGAITNGREYRVMLSFRIKGNPTFEEVCEKII